jgi:hypothetical protein
MKGLCIAVANKVAISSSFTNSSGVVTHPKQWDFDRRDSYGIYRF